MRTRPAMTGKELIGHLKKVESGGIKLVGIAKAGTSDEEILFSRGPGCERWVTLPISIIQSAEVLGTVPCAGHEHQLVRLSIHPPASEEGRALTDLVRHSAAAHPPLAATHPLARAAAAPMRAMNFAAAPHGDCFPVDRMTPCPDGFSRISDEFGNEFCCR